MTEYNKYTDKELTILLKKDDRTAYAEIYERYSRLLINHAYRILEDRAEVSDLVYDTMLNLWEKRHNVNPDLSLSSYLYKAVRNRVFNLMSRQKVSEKYTDSFIAYMANTHAYSDEFLLEKELTEFLESEIKSLPEKMREVFILYKLEELNYSEIAERLNISDKTAKQQVYKAVKILKSKIDQYLLLSFCL